FHPPSDRNYCDDSLIAKNGDIQIGGLNTTGEFQDKVIVKISRIGADNALVTPNAGGSLSAIIIASSIKLG
ncbi:7160_t:CDS:2, partial [Funneliformis geosporum]